MPSGALSELELETFRAAIPEAFFKPTREFSDASVIRRHFTTARDLSGSKLLNLELGFGSLKRNKDQVLFVANPDVFRKADAPKTDVPVGNIML